MCRNKPECRKVFFAYHYRYCTNDDVGCNNIALVMEDEIYPLHSLDDTKNNRQFVSWLCALQRCTETLNSFTTLCVDFWGKRLGGDLAAV